MLLFRNIPGLLRLSRIVVCPASSSRIVLSRIVLSRIVLSRIVFPHRLGLPPKGCCLRGAADCGYSVWLLNFSGGR
jgi:hypothetical protein